MVSLSLNNCSAYKSKRILTTGLYVICAAAYLESSVLTCINCAYMKMCVRNRLTGNDLTYNYVCYIFSNFPSLFNLETTVKKLLLKLLGFHIYINKIFKTT